MAVGNGPQNHLYGFESHTGVNWVDARVVQGNGLQNRKAAGSNPALPSQVFLLSFHIMTKKLNYNR